MHLDAFHSCIADALCDVERLEAFTVFGHLCFDGSGVRVSSGQNFGAGSADLNAAPATVQDLLVMAIALVTLGCVDLDRSDAIVRSHDTRPSERCIEIEDHDENRCLWVYGERWWAPFGVGTM